MENVEKGSPEKEPTVPGSTQKQVSDGHESARAVDAFESLPADSEHVADYKQRPGRISLVREMRASDDQADLLLSGVEALPDEMRVETVVWFPDGSRWEYEEAVPVTDGQVTRELVSGSVQKVASILEMRAGWLPNE